MKDMRQGKINFHVLKTNGNDGVGKRKSMPSAGNHLKCSTVSKNKVGNFSTVSAMSPCRRSKTKGHNLSSIRLANRMFVSAATAIIVCQLLHNTPSPSVNASPLETQIIENDGKF